MRSTVPLNGCYAGVFCVCARAGVSYGLTQQLFSFWRKSGFQPLYLRQSASDTTGEFTCIMVAPLEHPQVQGGTAWLDPLVTDFKVRSPEHLLGANPCAAS